MAAGKLDKSKLGVEKDVFQKTEIRFIDENAPLVGFINSVILEDNRDSIKVIKDGTNNRPYLVLYNPILHAKIAYYMTTSVTPPQMKIENKIWGHHYIKTPDRIYNYLENSSLKGKADKDKLHIIDKERFLFVTDDSMKDVESRAKRAEDINISMNLHYSNAAEIAALVEGYLKPEEFEKVVSAGRKERWVYNRKLQNPVIYSPTAMYLLLYLNGMNQYQNAKLKATPELLEERKKTTIEVVDVISDYINHDERLKALQKKNTVAYKVYKSARYYNGLSPRTFKGMEALENLDATYFGSDIVKKEDLNDYANLCGHPIKLIKLSLDERIEIELDRYNVKDSKHRESVTRIIHELLIQEQKLQKRLAGAAKLVIEDLNRNSREKLDLSSFPLDPNLLNSVKMISQDENNRNLVKGFISSYYDNLKEQFIREVSARKQFKSAYKFMKEKKEHEAEFERLANEYALSELSSLINKKYFGTFDSAFRQYKQGYLLPKSSDLKDFEGLKEEISIDADNSIVIGAKLYEKLRTDLNALNSFNERISACLYGLNLEMERLEDILKTKEGKLALDLFGAVDNIYTKTRLRCEGKSEQEKLKEVKKAVVDLLDLEKTPSSEIYTAVSLEDGSTEKEFLATLQAIANYKAELRGFYNIRMNKLKLIAAIKGINTPEIIASYTQTVNLVKSFDPSYLERPETPKPRDIKKMSDEVDGFIKDIKGGKLTNNGYAKIEEGIYSHLTHMNNFIAATNGRIKEKENLDKALDDYKGAIENARGQVRTIIDEAKNVYLKKLKEEIAEFFEEEKAKYNDEQVALYDEKGRVKRLVSGADFKEGSISYNEKTKEFLVISNYQDEEKDYELEEQLFDKLFPSETVMMEAIDRKLSKCSSPKEANKVLKQEIEKLYLVIDQLSEYMQKTMPELYTNILIDSKDVLGNKITWQEQLESFRFPELKRENFDVDEEVFEQNMQALSALYKELDCIVEDSNEEHNKYKDAVYRAVEENISKMQYRTDLTQDIEYYLWYSFGQKGKIEVMAPMPSAIIGDNGICEKLQAYTNSKIKLIHALDDLLQDIRELTDYHAERNDQKSFVEIADELPIRTPEYKRVKTMVLDRLIKVMNEVSDAYYDDDEYVCSSLESMRLFALRGEEERNFLIQKKGLAETFKIYQYGLKNGRVARANSSQTIKEITQMISADVLKNIPKLKEIIRRGELHIPCGEEDEIVTEMLDKFFVLMNQSDL